MASSYGSTSQSHHHHHHSRSQTHTTSHPSGAADTLTEHHSLLPTKQDRDRPLSRRIREYLNHDISRNNGDYILLFCYVITGLLDSSATAGWGAFVSMQTGNSIYFGLGIADPQGSKRWIKSGVSLASFFVGSFFFARFHRYFSPRRRWVLVASFGLQLIFIAVAVFIVLTNPATSPGNGHDLHWHLLVPLGLVAFQSSGQAVTSRVLQHGSLTSVVLTSIYCDLFSDAKLFDAPTQNAERNKRIAAPVLLIFGAALGGLLGKTELGMAATLLTAVLCKFVIIVAWMVWKNEPEMPVDED